MSQYAKLLFKEDALQKNKEVHAGDLFNCNVNVSEGTKKELKTLNKKRISSSSIVFPVDLGNDINANIAIRRSGSKYVIIHIQQIKNGKKVRGSLERLLVHLENGNVYMSDGNVIGTFLFPSKLSDSQAKLSHLEHQMKELFMHAKNTVTQKEKRTVIVMNNESKTTLLKVTDNFYWATKKLAWFPMKLLGTVLATKIGMFLLLSAIITGPTAIAIYQCKDDMLLCLKMILQGAQCLLTKSYQLGKWLVAEGLVFFTSKAQPETAKAVVTDALKNGMSTANVVKKGLVEIYPFALSNKTYMKFERLANTTEEASGGWNWKEAWNFMIWFLF